MKGSTKLALLGGAVVLGIAIAERAKPLRQRTRAQGRRDLRNLAMGAACAAVVQAVEVPITRKVAAANAAGGRGLAQKMPRGLRTLAGVLAMDYGFYLWHVATHKVPFLWRFHRVHHNDPDLTASTAVRFHAIDMLISLPWRMAQVRLSGVDARGLAIWRQLFNFSILFHHANLALGRWDRRLAWVLTTPRMHGVHHAREKALRDSNWTSGISVWDRLHGTYIDGDAQPPTGIDDPAALDDVPLPAALTAPFKPLPSARRTM